MLGEHLLARFGKHNHVVVFPIDSVNNAFYQALFFHAVKQFGKSHVLAIAAQGFVAHHFPNAQLANNKHFAQVECALVKSSLRKDTLLKGQGAKPSLHNGT